MIKKNPHFTAAVKARKKEVQAALQSRLRIIVDKPKQNAGNSNCGNTARRFFDNVEVVAEITG